MSFQFDAIALTNYYDPLTILMIFIILSAIVVIPQISDMTERLRISN